MTVAIAYLLVPALPVLLAPLLFVPGGSRLLPVVPWVPATALLLVPFLGEIVEFPWLLLGARLGIDAGTLPLVLLAAFAWTLAGWHARETLPRERQVPFFFFWLLAWCGNLCVFLTLDAASFYAAYGMMTIAAYGLVVHNERPEDYRAGRVYLTMALLGEALLIAGLLLLGSEAGNVPLERGPELVALSSWSGLIAALMLAGFGVKMGLLGLHMWLPLAHPQAPVPASAILSGVILKAGLIGWIRFLPLGEPGFELIGSVMLVIGMATAFFGVGVGLAQQRAKSLLAYSSVSQMGLITVLISLALLDPGSAPLYIWLATLFALHHGVAKAALFIGVDLARLSPRTARWLLWLPAASLAGLPLTSGALAKSTWKSALPVPWGGLELWLLASSAATTVLMARFLWLVWPASAADAGRLPGWRPVMPWLSLAGASLVLPWAYALATDASLAGVAMQFGYLRDTTVPVMGGVVVAAVGAWFLRRRSIPRIPEGDLLALLPAVPRIPRLPALRARTLGWQPHLARIEARMTALTPALLLGAVLLGGAIVVSLVLP